MSSEPLDSLIRDLQSPDSFTRFLAVRRLFKHRTHVVAALPFVFRLTFDECHPLASTSRLFIRKLGASAVDFLVRQVHEGDAAARARALELLAQCGCWHDASTRLVEQRLRPRREDLPEWGCDPELIIRLFRGSVNDEDLSVRFVAASGLENFGRHLDETVPVFVTALRDGSRTQQNWAALHLGRLGPLAAPAAGALKRRTSSDCRYTALAAANALSSLSTAE